MQDSLEPFLNYLAASHLKSSKMTSYFKSSSKNLVFTILFNIVLVSTGYSQPITNGLISYWPFDGSAIDQTGNGANGVVTGATLTSDRNDLVDKAYSFYNYQYIVTAPLVRSTKALTVSIWCYPTSLSGVNRWIVGQRDNAAGDQFQMAYNQSTTYVSIFYGPHDPLLMQCQPLQLNTWNHIVLRTSGNSGDVLEAWINNVHQGSATLTDDITFNFAEEVTFGGQGWSPQSGSFLGKIDDAMVFDRVLSTSEIQYLFSYNENSPGLWQENSDNIYYPGKVAINRTDLPAGFDLAVDGKIVTKEVKVTLSEWPDYIFETGHDLIPLDKLESEIQRLGHLPNIPPASEVLNDGILIGQMNARLLEKIEELTLYMIDLNKQVQELKDENKALKNEIYKSKED